MLTGYKNDSSKIWLLLRHWTATTSHATNQMGSSLMWVERKSSCCCWGPIVESRGSQPAFISTGRFQCLVTAPLLVAPRFWSYNNLTRYLLYNVVTSKHTICGHCSKSFVRGGHTFKLLCVYHSLLITAPDVLTCIHAWISFSPSSNENIDHASFISNIYAVNLWSWWWWWWWYVATNFPSKAVCSQSERRPACACGLASWAWKDALPLSFANRYAKERSV